MAAKLELYGLRFNPAQMVIVNEFLIRMDGFALVSIHKLVNGECELYTYQANRNNLAYDTFKKFDSKDFILGYFSGVNDALNNHINFA